MPPDIWLGYASLNPSKPRISRYLFTVSSTFALSFSFSSEKAMFCFTVSHGIRRGSWNTMDILGLFPHSLPFSIYKTSPPVFSSRPHKILKSVVLPQPLFPTIVTKLCFSTKRSIPSKTGTSLFLSIKIFDKFLIFIPVMISPLPHQESIGSFQEKIVYSAAQSAYYNYPDKNYVYP